MAGITYISWAESCSRSDHTARELGGTSHMVYAPWWGSRPSTILFKYLQQWFRTGRILSRERPNIVFVMTPPLVASLPAFWYAFVRGKRVVIDAHSAAFLHPRWRRLQWLQRLLCRRAVTTLVHNTHLAERVRALGAHATLVPDVPVVFDRVDPFPRPATFTVAVACSFNPDEPIAAMLDAAALLPDIRFFVTGDVCHLAPELAGRVPPNVTLTGFLSAEAYGGLLSSADAVMTLTTRDHTMLRGAYEAIYQGTPVIVSDWVLLRDAFDEGAVHVDNSSAQIVEAVRRVAADPRGYRAGAMRLRDRKRRQWVRTKDELLNVAGRVVGERHKVEGSRDAGAGNTYDSK